MSVNRRRFTRVLFLGGMATTAAFGAGAFVRFLWPQDAEPPPRLRISKDDIPQAGDAPLEFIVGNKKGYLVRLSGDDDLQGLVSLSRACAFERCTVAWLGKRAGPGFTDAYFRCACCGSTYNRFGFVCGGPADRSLERAFRIAERPDGDLVVGYAQQSLLTLP